jgi:hypothetical protein
MNVRLTINSLLADLGSTPDEVASVLRTHGIHGVRYSASVLNPLVRYLKCHLFGSPSMDVFHSDRIRLDIGGGKNEDVPNPEPVRRFLDAFNHGDYPDLVEKEAVPNKRAVGLGHPLRLRYWSDRQ